MLQAPAMAGLQLPCKRVLNIACMRRQMHIV